MKGALKNNTQDSPSPSKSTPFFSPSTIQAKLTIGQPNDPYEKEADAMAEEVMRMPKNIPGIQTKSSAAGEDDELNPKRKENFLSLMPLLPQRQVSKTGILQKKQLMRKAESGEEVATPELSSTLNSTKGSGAALPDSTNQFMSNAFGNDFSQVKIHTDSKAVQMNQGLNARAFTHGTDVYFNKGEYSPNSSSGKSLLAHELTHVVQQSGGKELEAAPKRIQRSWVGALIGGGIGAAAGGLLGGLLGGPLGAVLGGILGAGIGALIGHFSSNDSEEGSSPASPGNEEVVTEEAITEEVENAGERPLLEADLQAYLLNLLAREEIENQTDSDRKARAIIDLWLAGSAAFILSSDVQILLIRELVTGPASLENQASILAYFRAVPYSDFNIVITAIERDNIVNYFGETDRPGLNAVLDSRIGEAQNQTANPSATFDSNTVANAQQQFTANALLPRTQRQNCINIIRALAPQFFSDNPALAASVRDEIGALRGDDYKMTAVGALMTRLGLVSDFIHIRFEGGNGNTEPTQMIGSAWDEIMNSVGDDQGWHIFGMAPFNGYHSVTLLVHKTAEDVFLYWADQWAIDPGDDFMEEDNSVSGFRRYEREGFDNWITDYTNSRWLSINAGDPDNPDPRKRIAPGRRWSASTKIWKFRSEPVNNRRRTTPTGGAVQPKRKGIQAQFANEDSQKKTQLQS